MDMRCRRCGKKGEIRLPRHNAIFCKDCFLVYYTNQVRRNIEKENMFGLEDRILVAVSGGKDSMALWHILLQLGYNVTGIHFNVGIGEYSAKSQEVIESFAQKYNAPVIIRNIPQELHLDVEKLSRRLRRSTCSICGAIKRYLINKITQDEGFDVVATGHNLDDEAATLLGNILGWQEGYLAKQSPVLPSSHPKLAKKVKPLYTLTEEENLRYVIYNDIEFVPDRCPLSKGASSIRYKEMLNRLEELSPGLKQHFLVGFYKKGRKYFEEASAPVELKECKICGQVTTAEVCSFCRLMEIAKQI